MIINIAPDNAESEKHLRGLYQSNIRSDWGDPAFHDFAMLRAGVISIHNGVNAIVHNGKPNSGGDDLSVAVPAKQQNGDVMIPVQENDWSFSKDKKSCI